MCRSQGVVDDSVGEDCWGPWGFSCLNVSSGCCFFNSQDDKAETVHVWRQNGHTCVTCVKWTNSTTFPLSLFSLWAMVLFIVRLKTIYQELGFITWSQKNELFCGRSKNTEFFFNWNIYSTYIFREKRNRVGPNFRRGQVCKQLAATGRGAGAMILLMEGSSLIKNLTTLRVKTSQHTGKSLGLLHELACVFLNCSPPCYRRQSEKSKLLILNLIAQPAQSCTVQGTSKAGP